jgi:hypothetical protein
MPRDRARALSRRGSRTLTDLANDYALTYAPYIQAAVRDVGHNYRQVAKWLTRERIPAQRDGRWRPFDWHAPPHPLQEVSRASAPQGRASPGPSSLGSAFRPVYRDRGLRRVGRSPPLP